MTEQQQTDIRWDILTIGHLSRNKFWGESDGQAYRAPRCTCTLIRTGGRNIIVDPSCPPSEMAQVLDQRTGLKPEEIDTVFLTHFHGDHRYGIEAFPGARWVMASREIDDCTRVVPESSPDFPILRRLQPAEEGIAEGIELLATPGHCMGHHSIVFTSGGMRVVLAADAAMTKDFFLSKDYYFNTVDPAAAVHSIAAIAEIADIIIPGHDNYFFNKRR